MNGKGLMIGAVLMFAAAAKTDAVTLSIWDDPGGTASWGIDVDAGSHGHDEGGWELGGFLADGNRTVSALWSYTDNPGAMDSYFGSKQESDPRLNGGTLTAKRHQELTLNYAGDAREYPFLVPMFSRTPYLAAQLDHAIRNHDYGSVTADDCSCVCMPDTASALALMGLGLTGLGILKRRLI